MQTLLLVAVGGATGAVMRYLLGAQALRAFGAGWPYGTLIANVLGGLLMGALVAVLAARGGPDQEKWRLLLGVGVLGGFTTFSTYAVQSHELVRSGHPVLAMAYLGGTVLAALLAVVAGVMLVRRLAGRRRRTGPATGASDGGRLT